MTGIEELKEEARKMGRRAGMEKEVAEMLKGEKGKMSRDEADVEVARSFDNYTQYAGWANHILPTLRKMAGYEDTGTGTYRKVPEGKDETELTRRVDELTRAFRSGFESKSMESLREVSAIKGEKQKEKLEEVT